MPESFVIDPLSLVWQVLCPQVGPDPLKDLSAYRLPIRELLLVQHLWGTRGSRRPVEFGRYLEDPHPGHRCPDALSDRHRPVAPHDDAPRATQIPRQRLAGLPITDQSGVVVNGNRVSEERSLT